MPHGFRCAKKTLLRKRQTKTSVPQLHTGMRCGSGGIACQSREHSHKHATQVTEPRQSRASRASGRPWSLAVNPQISPTSYFFCGWGGTTVSRALPNSRSNEPGKNSGRVSRKSVPDPGLRLSAPWWSSSTYWQYQQTAEVLRRHKLRLRMTRVLVVCWVRRGDSRWRLSPHVPFQFPGFVVPFAAVVGVVVGALPP